MAGRMMMPERAIRRPWRFDLRILLSVLVTLAALGGMLLYAGSLSATRPVLVATHDLPAGAILGRDDLTVVQVPVTDAVYAAAVPGDALDQVLGQRLAEPVHSQQILARAQLGNQPQLAPDQLALTIPVTAASAADGRLHPGDDVQVLLTRDKNAANPETVVVLERVRVYSVGYDERATLGNPTVGGATDSDVAPLASLTLAVTAEQARALANARHSGDLDVALLPPLPGAPPASPAPGGH
ncbi:MAG TPA: Flp pilus assembly protein CpaB [Thermomicrobiales bacterium]|nr:Flp pilus assembly protein CpaB [Thermomicrobiales bacterium]